MSLTDVWDTLRANCACLSRCPKYGAILRGTPQ